MTRGVELVTTIALRLADMEFGAAAGAALVPGAQGHRIGGLGLRFAAFGGLDAAHAAAVSLLLRALRMDSTLRVAGRSTDGAQRPRGRMDLKQWDGHAVISHKGGHSKSKVDAPTQGRVFTIAIAFSLPTVAWGSRHCLHRKCP